MWAAVSRRVASCGTYVCFGSAAPSPWMRRSITARKPVETQHASGGVSMPGRVGGKVALVTGGASGIGRATALTFAREGAKLVIADMNAEGGQQTVHMISENGGEAIFIRTDVSQAVEVQALISKAVETYGRLDCAHNNAGVSSPVRASIADYPEED